MHIKECYYGSLYHLFPHRPFVTAIVLALTQDSLFAPRQTFQFFPQEPRFYEDVHMLLGVCVGLFPGKLGWIQLVSLSPRRKRGGGGVLKLNIWSHTSPGCLLGKKLLRPKRGSDKKHQTINAVTPCVRPHHKTRSR